MGIKNLKHLLKTKCPSAIQSKQLTEYKGQIFAIDTSIFLYKYLYNNSDHLDGFVRQILRFLKHGITPLYVFDGRPPKEKNCVLKSRKERKDFLLNKQEKLRDEIEKRSENEKSLINDVHEEPLVSDQNVNDDLSLQSLETIKKKFAKVNRQIISVTACHIQSSMELFDLMGVPYVIADGEAEALCAKLSKLELVDACVSEDTDILPNGGAYFIRNFNPDKNNVEEYSLGKILETLEITYEQFLDLCILCGCDYTCKIYGIGPITAFKLIKSYHDLDNIIQQDQIKTKFKIPDNFEYKKARYLFEHAADNNDFTIIKKKICLTSKKTNELVLYLNKNSPKLKARYINEINKKLGKYINDINDLKKNTPNTILKYL